MVVRHSTRIHAPADNAKAFKTRPIKSRSRVTNGTKFLPGVDGRSAWARRFYDLCASHAADAGGAETLTEAKLSLIRRASALEVTLERMEVEMAEGKDVDLDQFARSAGHLRRILETIGVNKVAKDVTPSLASLIAEHTAPAKPAPAGKAKGAPKTIAATPAEPEASSLTTSIPDGPSQRVPVKEPDARVVTDSHNPSPPPADSSATDAHTPIPAETLVTGTHKGSPTMGAVPAEPDLFAPCPSGPAE